MPGQKPEESDSKLFPNTRWSLVAQSREPEAAGRALSELCQIYWFPVYAYIRTLGKNHHDAQDLAQSFFTSLLDRGDFAKADGDRGKLRTFLCVAVKRYVMRSDRDRNRLKRGGGTTTVSLDAARDERQFRQEPCDGDTPETYFDKRWATALIQSAISQLESEFEAKGKTALFAELRPYISIKATGGRQGDAAARLGIRIGTFRMAITRLRQRYAEILRDSIADTLTDRSIVEEELGHLLEVFGK